MGAKIDVIEEVATQEVPLEYLEREICQLASNIAAATCRWLLLLAEFDRREGWGVWGARSCAEWLSWRCGIGRVAARDHLRVAQRLAELQLVKAAFAAGELSYSKVRAISRVATAETEQTLVELARHATASHMEQIARAYRGLKRRMAKDGKGGEEKDGGYLYWYWDDDGYLVIVGRFPPAEGAIFVSCKSWQVGFNAPKILAQLRQEAPNPVKPQWLRFRELWSDKWAFGFRREIERLTGESAFTYCIAVTHLHGDPSGWQADPTIQRCLGGNPFQFLPLADMWSAVLDQVTTTPASSEIGRMAQLLKAAGLTDKNIVAPPTGPAPGSEAELEDTEAVD